MALRASLASPRLVGRLQRNILFRVASSSHPWLYDPVTCRRSASLKAWPAVRSRGFPNAGTSRKEYCHSQPVQPQVVQIVTKPSARAADYALRRLSGTSSPTAKPYPLHCLRCRLPFIRLRRKSASLDGIVWRSLAKYDAVERSRLSPQANEGKRDSSRRHVWRSLAKYDAVERSRLSPQANEGKRDSSRRHARRSLAK